MSASSTGEREIIVVLDARIPRRDALVRTVLREASASEFGSLQLRVTLPDSSELKARTFDNEGKALLVTERIGEHLDRENKELDKTETAGLGARRELIANARAGVHAFLKIAAAAGLKIALESFWRAGIEYLQDYFKGTP